MSDAFVTGEKVRLRGLQRSDMEVYRRWLANPEVTAFLEMGWKPLSDAEVESVFASMTASPEAVAFAVEDKATGDLAGVAGLYLIQWLARRAQFNILLGEPKMWNRGLGTETLKLLLDYGFETLNLESIQLGVNADNLRAVRSYEKAGFVHEGRRRKFVYRNGRYFDSLMMSMLREEYAALKRSA